MCKNTTQPSLEELYTTDNLTLLKRAITKLTNKQDNKTFKAQSGGKIDYFEYDDYSYCINCNKYDLCMIIKQTKTKKFIFEAQMFSGKSTAIRKMISAHTTDSQSELGKAGKFKVIVPTVNIAEEFYIKMSI